VRVLLPSECGHGLERHGWDAVWDDGHAVVLGLSVEYLNTWHRDNTGLEAVLVLEDLDGIDGDTDLGTSGNDGDVWLVCVNSNVTTLGGLLDCGSLELRQVLASEGEDRWGVLAGQSDVVGGRGLVAVSWTPDHHVWQRTEVSESLDRLVSWSVLTKTDGVVGGDVDDTVLREGGETDGTGGVGDEVEESTTGWDDGTVGGHTVHCSSHGVLTDTVTHVASRPVTNAELWWLEVDGLLPAGVVGASQISRSRHELWNGVEDGLKDRLGQLAGSDGLVGSLVGWEGLLPALWKHTRKTTGQVSVGILVLLGVLLKELVPLLLSGGTVGGNLVAGVVDLLWNDEALGWVKTELLLDGLAVVLLEGVTVDTASTLELRTETNGGGQLDHGWLVLDLLGLLDGSLHTLEIGVTLLDVLDVPAVRLETLGNILGEGTLGVTVDGNVVVVVDGDQVTELQVTGHGSGLTGDTLHGATITEKGVGVVVDELKTWLVEGGGGVSLGDGKTNSVGETLTKRTSGNLNTWGVVALRVTWCDAVKLLQMIVRTITLETRCHCLHGRP